jgi:hypothetical protein
MRLLDWAEHLRTQARVVKAKAVVA